MEGRERNGGTRERNGGRKLKGEEREVNLLIDVDI